MNWISVKDKAPEFPCVVYDGENYPKVVTELLKIETDGETVYFEGEMARAIVFLKLPLSAECTHITHWLPLPELPKGE